MAWHDHLQIGLRNRAVNAGGLIHAAHDYLSRYTWPVSSGVDENLRAGMLVSLVGCLGIQARVYVSGRPKWFIGFANRGYLFGQ